MVGEFRLNPIAKVKPNIRTHRDLVDAFEFVFDGSSIVIIRL